MKILFIDESRKEKSRNEKYFFIQAGLMIDKEKIIDVEQAIEELKKSYTLETLKQIRKNYEKEKKIKFTRELFKILQKNKSKILSSVLGNIALRHTEKIENSYFGGLTFLIERYFINLDKENKVGLIIYDRINKTVHYRLRKKIYEFISTEKFRCRSRVQPFIDRIYPSILFNDSRFCNILQAVDLIALSLHSAIAKNFDISSQKLRFDPNELQKCNLYLQEYWPLFVKDPKGNVNGWGIKVWW